MTREEELRATLLDLHGAAMRMCCPSGNLDELALGIIAMRDTAPDPHAVADSLALVESLKRSKSVLESA